jgi:protein-disulfide isomerase
MLNFTVKSAAFACAILIASSAQAAPAKDWSQNFTETAVGAFMAGNPAAPNKVVEYMSYTCPHCASFEVSEAPKIKNPYVSSGKASFEIRNLVLNQVDLTLAMLARCGGKGRYFGNHKYLMANQKTILGKASLISAGTQDKLKSQNITAFMIGAYTDMGLKQMVAQRGITDAQARACLADPSALNKIISLSQGGTEKYNLDHTPSFLINGKYVDAHSAAEITSKFVK